MSDDLKKRLHKCIDTIYESGKLYGFPPTLVNTKKVLIKGRKEDIESLLLKTHDDFYQVRRRTEYDENIYCVWKVRVQECSKAGYCTIVSYGI